MFGTRSKRTKNSVTAIKEALMKSGKISSVKTMKHRSSLLLAILVFIGPNAFGDGVNVDFQRSLASVAKSSKIDNAEVTVLRSSVKDLSKSAFDAAVVGEPSISQANERIGEKSITIGLKVQISWNQLWLEKLKERLELVGKNIGSKNSIYTLAQFTKISSGFWRNGTYISSDSSQSVIGFVPCTETRSCINWADESAFESTYRFLGNSCGRLSNLDGLKSIRPNSWVISSESYEKSRMDIASEILSYDEGYGRGGNHYLSKGSEKENRFILEVTMLSSTGSKLFSTEVGINPHLALSRDSKGEIAERITVILEDAKHLIDVSINVPVTVASKISRIEVVAKIKKEALELPQYREQG